MSPGDEDGLPRAEARGSTPPDGARARLSRSGRMMPLVRPPTIAPPIAMPDEGVDDYDEIEITAEAEPGETPGKAKARWWQRSLLR